MNEKQKLLLARFVKETNLDERFAQDVLAGSDWKYEQAIASFKQMLRTNDRRLSFTSPPPAQSSTSPPPSSRQPVKTSNRAGQRSPPVVSPDGTSPLHRGISRANLKAKTGAKKLEVPVTVTENKQARVDSKGYYFMLPNLHTLPQDLSSTIKRDLLDLQTMKHLHRAGCLNWWSSSGVCGPLYAMDTSGDGNCLLHAASLSIWGMHDRELTLRTALNKVLTDVNFIVKLKRIQRRWKRQQIQVNRELGLEYTAQEWEAEWESVLKLSSVSPRHQMSPGGTTQNGVPDNETTYESLEEIHVFVLAHILHRPIIIIGDEFLRDVNNEPLAPNTFRGIYLPLEADPSECCRSPVVLAYDMSHFCPLLPMASDKRGIPNVIPLTDSDRNLLRVQFAVDPGLGWKFDNSKDIAVELSTEQNTALLHKYLDLVKVPTSPKETARKAGKLSARDVASKEHILGVLLSNKRHPEYDNLIKNYLLEARRKLTRSTSTSSSSSSMTSVDGPPSYNHATTHPSSGKGSRNPQSPSKTNNSSSHASPSSPPPYGYATVSPSRGGARVTQSSSGNTVYHNENTSHHTEKPRKVVREGPPVYEHTTLPSRGKQTHTGHDPPTSPKGTKPLPIPTGGPPPYNYAIFQERGDRSGTGTPTPAPRENPSLPKPAPRGQQSPPVYNGTKSSSSLNGQWTQQPSPGGSRPNPSHDVFSNSKGPNLTTRQCKTAKCKNLGTEDTQFYCTKCWLKK